MQALTLSGRSQLDKPRLLPPQKRISCNTNIAFRGNSSDDGQPGHNGRTAANGFSDRMLSAECVAPVVSQLSVR